MTTSKIEALLHLSEFAISAKVSVQHTYINFIIWCTVDPFLFENFYTEDGDKLRAKFKAFKFPESNFVLFKGVVNVCLDRCNSVECANGQLGYGRRKRRNVPSDASELQRLYEVSMSTIIRFEEDQDSSIQSETQPEQIPSLRQRHETLLVEKAVLNNVFKSEERSLADLERQFGSIQERKTFVEFELDEEDRRNGAMQQFASVTLLFTFMIALGFI